MAEDYITNGPISVPLYIDTVSPDVDLNGFYFSYDIGMFFMPTTVQLPLKLPPPFEDSGAVS